MARRFSREVDSAIAMAAERYGIAPDTMRGIARMESSGNPRLVNKYGYSGLFQFTNREFERVGGRRGGILDPIENSMAAARVFKGHQEDFGKKFNRAPTPAELYMIHQQGWGGFQAHMENPDRPAWENMASTREGRGRAESDPDWPRRAIRENTLPDARRFGANITSRQFMDSWTARVSREPGLSMDTAAAAVPNSNNSEAVLDDWRGELGVDPEAAAYANPPRPLNQDEATAYADRPDITPTNPAVANVADPTRTSSIVQGVDAPTAGLNMGSLFGGGPIFGGVPGASGIGAGLAAAGKALSSVRLSQYQSPDVGAQMAALDRDAQQPVTIQPRKPRTPPGRQSRGGAA